MIRVSLWTLIAHPFFMNDGANRNDVREFDFRTPRVATNLAFTLQLNSTREILRAVCHDISERGLAADLPRRLAPGTEVTLTFEFPNCRTPVQIPAVVRNQQGTNHHGLTFVYSLEAERAQVRAFLRSIAPEPLELTGESPDPGRNVAG